MPDLTTANVIDTFMAATTKAGARAAIGAGITDPTWPKAAYVETTGDNGTAVIGDPALPFLTPQGAYNAISAAASGQYVIRLGVGSFGEIALDADSLKLVGIYGVPGGSSTMGAIHGIGAGGTFGTLPNENGGTGGMGRSLKIFSDYSIKINAIDLSGGAGGDGASIEETSANGGSGGQAGELKLINVDCDSVTAVAGNGGGGTGDLGVGGNAGAAQPVEIIGLKCETLTIKGGEAGTGSFGGTSASPELATISGLRCNGAAEIVATGFIEGYAGSKSLSGGITDALLP
jgi:hypothetical protein